MDDEEKCQKEREYNEIKHSPDIKKDIFPVVRACPRAFSDGREGTIPFGLK